MTLACLGVAGCHPRSEVVTPAPTAARGEVPPAKAEAARDEPLVLESFAAGPYTYEVLIERRRPPAEPPPLIYDPFGVRLLKAAHTVDKVQLDDTSCGIESMRAGGAVRGADSESKTWTTEDEHCAIASAARTVALTEHAVGLLVTHQRGFEYRYSSQFLYLAQGDQLRTLWSYDEDTLGWQRTQTSAIAGRAAGQQDVAFIRLARDENIISHEFSALRLHLDANAVEIRESPLPDEQTPLYVLALGDFPNKAAALKVRADCVEHLELLTRSLLPGLATPRLYLGAVYARRADAEAAVPDALRCPDVPKASILEYRSTRGVAHDSDH